MGLTIGVRCDDNLIEKIDQLRRDEPDIPTRAETLRRLVKAALPNHRRRPEHAGAPGEQLGAAV
jgi:hypothetical protein